MHQINGTVRFQQITPNPSPGVRCARNQQNTQTITHAIHDHHAAIILFGQFAIQGVNPKFDNILARISNIHAQFCVLANGDSKFDNTARPDARINERALILRVLLIIQIIHTQNHWNTFANDPKGRSIQNT